MQKQSKGFYLSETQRENTGELVLDIVRKNIKRVELPTVVIERLRRVGVKSKPRDEITTLISSFTSAATVIKEETQRHRYNLKDDLTARRL